MKKKEVPGPRPENAGEQTPSDLHRRETGPEKPKRGNIDSPKGRRKR